MVQPESASTKPWSSGVSVHRAHVRGMRFCAARSRSMERRQQSPRSRLARVMRSAWPILLSPTFPAHLSLSVEGLEASDIGSSTGGFVQVLLGRGAAHVTGIEVGHGQLHQSLGADMRVTNLEGLNARDLAPDYLRGRHIRFVTSDVSFISLKLALPPALGIAETGAHCLLLVKPQFEAGREAVGKGGLLRALHDGARIADELFEWLDAQPGWRSLGHCPSPIEGGDGNREYLLAGVKDQ